ncbi:helix-turn-helix transcriptional regulator [Actinomadura sp. NPDC048955]|uniref:helix-turn-helix transcriptional regulator n=1 Tax=Actinomadura sp. NPDC048955 TaxID=3158228 RepID=UPI00340A00E9
MTSTTFGDRLRHMLRERGMSQNALARETNYGPSYLSKVVNGHSSLTLEMAQKIDAVLKTGGEFADTYCRPAPIDLTDPPRGEEHEDAEEMERRRLFQALAVLGIAMTPAATALEHIRDAADRTLGRDDSLHVEDWENTLVEYGYAYMEHSPSRLLRDLALDLVLVQQATRVARSNGRSYNAWCRITGGLAVLIAKTLCNLGEHRQARGWWNTASRATARAGDHDLELWVRGEQLIHGLYQGRPTQILLREADLVRRAASTHRPSRGMAKVHTASAQLHALSGDVDSANSELAACRTVYEMLPTAVTEDVSSVNGWARDRLTYTETWVHAYLGAAAEMERAAAQTLSLLPPGPVSVRAHTQIALMRGVGHVRAGDVATGISLAERAYANHPADQRTTLITALASQVLTDVPIREAQRPAVGAYRELLGPSGLPALT